MSLVRSVRTIGNGKLYFPNDHKDNSGLSTSMFTKNAHGIMYATESSSTDSYDPKYLLDSPSPSEELLNTSPSEELLNTSPSEVSGNPFHQRHSSSFHPSRDYDACQLSYDCEDIVSQRPDSLQYNDGRVTLKLQELERVLFDDNEVDGDDVFARGQCMDIDDEWFSQIGTVLLHDSPKESTSADSNISSSSSYKEISVTAPQTPKQMLFSCAAAIQDGNIEQASSMINELRQMVSIQGEPLERTAAYMVEALAARMATSGKGLYKALKCKEALFSERLSAMQVLFEVCPYFRFGFMAANGAILEAFKDEKRVHIIDFEHYLCYFPTYSFHSNLQILHFLAPFTLHFSGYSIKIQVFFFKKDHIPLYVITVLRRLKMGKKSWILWVVTLLLCWSKIAMAKKNIKYKDPKQPVEVRVKDLLGRMTLAEKIGQMTQIDRSSATIQVMKDYYIGSVLSGGGSEPLPKATAADWVNMVNDYQNGSMSTRLGIPMIYGIDAIHGHNNVFNATIFPHNVGLGAARDPELMRRIGAATALEVRATGIPYAFAPCIAVCRDPRWGRCYESYSEDPKIVQEMTDIIIGLQGEIPYESRKGIPYVAGKNKVAACAKHFVGDGGTTKGINENNTVTNMHELLSIHMPAYDDAIIKGVATVMASYSSWNGQKMHANHDLVTGFLKGTLKFKGFVISDWEGIDRITSPPHANYTYSVESSILAGIDMVMVPYNFTEFINDLTYLVKNNFIPMARIDDAVERILLVKFTMGLFENPYTDFSLIKEVGSQEHRNLAREAVRKSLVLLKNGKTANDPLLPLPKKVSKILVAGSHADNLGFQCGGWTIAWQGFSGNDDTGGTTILGAIKSAVDPGTEVTYVENPDSKYASSGGFDYAIVVVGERPYAETAGDSPTLTIADSGPDVINHVCPSVKCVVIIISGRPLVIEPYLPSIDALVAAWLPGSEGQGITDILFGDYGFTGKLPRTWFKTVDQLPMNVGDPHYDPLFPFGFGLNTSKSTVARSVSSGAVGKPYVFGIMVSVFIGLWSVSRAFY